MEKTIVDFHVKWIVGIDSSPGRLKLIPEIDEKNVLGH